VVLVGRRCTAPRIPAASQAFALLRTYTAEAGSSPTSTTSSPAGRPARAANTAAASATCARRAAAAALPSTIVVIASSAPSGAPRDHTHFRGSRA
jgi:hypothetical protein